MSDQQKTPIVRTRAELQAELKHRFGDDPLDWAFQCSVCGTIFAAEDFMGALMAEGLTGTELYAQMNLKLGRECIGRHDKTRGCKWCTYGLYIPNGVEYVVIPDGSKLAHFPIAPAPEKRAQS